MQFLTPPLFPKKTVHSLHVRITEEGYQFFLLKILRANNKISVLESSQAASSTLTYLFQILNDKYPVLLSVDGSGIVHKRILKLYEDDAAGIKEVLLQDDVKKFSWTVEIDNGSSWYAIGKSDSIETIINTLASKNIHTLYVMIGAVTLYKFKSPQGLQEYESIGNYRFYTDSQRLSRIEFNPVTDRKHFELSGLEVESVYAHALVAAVEFYTAASKKNEYHQITANKRNWLYRTIYINARNIFVLLAFATLIIHGIILAVFRVNADEDEGSTARYAKSKTTYDSLVRLDKEKIQTDAIFHLNASKQYAYYLDQLAKDIPKGLTLTQLTINPPDASLLRTQGEYLFVEKLILVKGKSESNKILSDWILVLQRYPWILKIEGQTYEFNIVNEQGTFDFVIKTK